ncbi:MAG: 3-oxoacyl-(acyl-carrier-protein) reductase FabG [Firmicutes bacterium ADurb.Bin182]|nr:MAG: 3-oxoacyl-(acyl-carrier-protein) reductase FabG [Firmicutes bacterium ADurb.Bin182]
MFALSGKSALITGAAQGIGKTTAEKMSELGCRIAVADICREKTEAVVRGIRQSGGEAVGVFMDVTSNESIDFAVKEAANAFGGIDIVVNSAGILGTSSIEDMQRDGEWNRVLDIDLSGTFFVCQYALQYLKKSAAGRIINIASVTGRNGGFEGSMSYAAAKGGVIAITRGMARHLAKYRITVNAVCPATTKTEMLEGYTQERIDNQVKNILLGRLGKTEEIAAAVCYLASDEAAFVTGAMLDVNGGAYFG